MDCIMVKSPGFVLDDSSYNTHWPIRCVKLIGWGQIIHYNMLGAIHLLFIHYGDLYSAPSRLLLRSAPEPCTAKEKSFEARVECVRKNPGSNLWDKGSPFHTEDT